MKKNSPKALSSIPGERGQSAPEGAAFLHRRSGVGGVPPTHQRLPGEAGGPLGRLPLLLFTTAKMGEPEQNDTAPKTFFRWQEGMEIWSVQSERPLF